MARKSITTFFDKVYLKEIDGRYCETKLSSYTRYKKTIKPLDDFINYCLDKIDSNSAI